jgi:hypothetical protein
MGKEDPLPNPSHVVKGLTKVPFSKIVDVPVEKFSVI